MAKKAATKTAASSSKTRSAAAKTAAPAAQKSFNLKALPFPVGATLAEFVGTFALALVFVNYAGNVLIALIAVIVLVLVLAPLSGSHLNPALTIAAWVARRISGVKAIAYVVAQVLGAMLALVVAKAFVVDEVNPMTGQSVAGSLYQAAALPDGDQAALWKAFGIEAIGMAVLGLGFAKALFTKSAPLTYAFTIGGAYMLGLAILKGAAVLNPAVAVTVGALSWSAWALAIYLLTPLAVAIVAVGLYRLMQRNAETA